jgi:hypothetical protein
LISAPSRWNKRSRGQAIQPLCEELKRQGHDPYFEVNFNWLDLPDVAEATAEERLVAEALLDHAAVTVADMRELLQSGSLTGRLRKSAVDPSTVLTIRNKGLALDIWLPGANIAVEFDERQHFSEERGVSLDAYPDTKFPFDVGLWRNRCTPKIYDIDPPGRDWQRAFRDAVRDLRCRANGLRLVRVHYQDMIEAAMSKIAAACLA